MPYIKQDRRIKIISSTPSEASTPGELNYMITNVIGDYLDSKKLSYQTINDIVGALEGAKAEFQRRIVAPYEDKKMLENGDVYT